MLRFQPPVLRRLREPQGTPSAAVLPWVVGVENLVDPKKHVTKPSCCVFLLNPNLFSIKKYNVSLQFFVAVL